MVSQCVNIPRWAACHCSCRLYRQRTGRTDWARVGWRRRWRPPGSSRRRSRYPTHRSSASTTPCPLLSVKNKYLKGYSIGKPSPSEDEKMFASSIWPLCLLFFWVVIFLLRSRNSFPTIDNNERFYKLQMIFVLQQNKLQVIHNCMRWECLCTCHL